MPAHQSVPLAQTAEPIPSCESSDAERLGVQTATTETPLESSKLSRRALVQLTLSVEDAGDRSTHTTTEQHRPAEQEAEPMAEAKDAKKKRRMFSAPLLRRSATASSAAASAASRIKSNFSTDKLTKLPTSLKRSTTSSGSATASTSARAADAAGTREDKANGDRAPTIPALKRASTDSKPREAKATPSHPHTRKFGIPSLMRVRTSSKEKEQVKPPPSPAFSASNCPLDSPEPQSMPNTTADSAPNSKVLPPLPPPHKPSSSTASRFVSRMPLMLKRVVSSSHTANTSSTQSVPHTTLDTSASSTPRDDFLEDNELEENERRSLLLMLQVPETQRRSQLPLMAASQTW
ncbi:hypothetical protein BBJ28_00005289 [Nothophytophthora sp. Chile5]|nr:hypothetical protein BBJ28_00005289 [Nothophytophthora sp. Chile5]